MCDPENENVIGFDAVHGFSLSERRRIAAAAPRRCTMSLLTRARPASPGFVRHVFDRRSVGLVTMTPVICAAVMLLSDYVFTHGEAAAAEAEIFIARTPHVGEAGKQNETFCDGVNQAVRNLDAAAFLCDVKHQMSSRSSSARGATRCAISEAKPVQREGGRVRAPSPRWQAAACSPV